MFFWNKRPNHRFAPFYLSNVDAHTTLFQYVQFIDMALKPCTKYSVGAYGPFLFLPEYGVSMAP